jgi:hypothetical protein
VNQVSSVVSLSVSSSLHEMIAWYIAKKTFPFVGTCHNAFLISTPLIHLQSFSIGLKVLIACFIKTFLSAKNRMRGLRFAHSLFHFA